MAVLLLAIVVIEGMLLLSWWRPYWVWGVPMFRRRIAAPYPALKAFPFHRLEREVAAEKWPDMVFRPLDKRSHAFRESFGLHFGWRYPPLMRGQIVVDLQRRQVQVIGRGSWLLMVAVVTAIPALKVAPGGVLVVAVVLVASYLVQRHRFLAVVAAIRRVLDQPAAA
ncbi:MAG: hypothetical protein JHC82_07135 [Stenotrophomonas sp.]|nr:hypothetical protein [Stenotrophomonas sp.]